MQIIVSNHYLVVQGHSSTRHLIDKINTGVLPFVSSSRIHSGTIRRASREVNCWNLGPAMECGRVHCATRGDNL